jgi:hypothetical protein
VQKPGADKMIILKWEGVDRIDLAHDRDKWWTIVNMVMNLRVE